MGSTPPLKDRKRPLDDGDASCRIFVGGLTKDTTADMLKGYFSYYGRVTSAEIMVNVETNKSRGFGFVTFEHPALIDNVLATPVHYLDGRQIDPKRFLAKNMRPRPNPEQNIKRAFLGGLPLDLTEEEMKSFFSVYGSVKDVEIVRDEKTQLPRGFGFIAFEDESVIDSLVKDRHIEIKHRTIEVKLARPRSSPVPYESRVAYGAPRYLTPSSYAYSSAESPAKRPRGAGDPSSAGYWPMTSPYDNYLYAGGSNYGGGYYPNSDGSGDGDPTGGQQNYTSGYYSGGDGSGSHTASSSGFTKKSNDSSQDAMMKMMQQFQGADASMMMPMMMSNMMMMQQMMKNMVPQQKQAEEKPADSSPIGAELMETMKKLMQQMISGQGQSDKKNS